MSLMVCPTPKRRVEGVLTRDIFGGPVHLLIALVGYSLLEASDDHTQPGVAKAGFFERRL